MIRFAFLVIILLAGVWQAGCDRKSPKAVAPSQVTGPATRGVHASGPTTAVIEQVGTLDIQTDDLVTSLEFTPDGSTLVAGTANSAEIKVLELSKGPNLGAVKRTEHDMLR